MASLPAAAPLPARALLPCPSREGWVAGVHHSCMYVLSGPDLVVVETADGVGLPCALRLGVDAVAAPFGAVRPGSSASVGAGRLIAGPVTVEVVRWWAPPGVRRPGRDRPPAAATGLGELLGDVPPPVDPSLDPHDLLGRGPGLTPAGDDVLVGWLLAVHHDAVLRSALAAAVADAGDRTTALSAALVREAVAGRGVPAALAVADALAGHGELEPALDRLLRVGHSSGAALAFGLLRGAVESAHHASVVAA